MLVCFLWISVETMTSTYHSYRVRYNIKLYPYITVRNTVFIEVHVGSFELMQVIYVSITISL